MLTFELMGNELSPMVQNVCANEFHLILIAECVQCPVLLSGNRHDMTLSYSYDVNSALELMISRV